MRADTITVHKKVFMFLSSQDVPDKYIVSKTIQKTAIEHDLWNSFEVYGDSVYNKTIFSKQVINRFNWRGNKMEQLLYSSRKMSVYRNTQCKLKQNFTGNC